MKAADRKLALRAARLFHRNVNCGAIAKKLRLANGEAAATIANIGLMIEQYEAIRLTDNEMLVMRTLARIEARRVALGERVAKANAVDFAAGKRSGWCGQVVKKRLFGGSLPFVVHTPNGHIWLTAAGWAFVWATGLILKNWKVPA